MRADSGAARPARGLTPGSVAAFVPPGDYGLVVFTAPFLVLIAMLTDLGMTSAITRAPSLSREEAGAAMGAMLSGAAVCAVLLALAAWPLERAIGMAGLEAGQGEGERRQTALVQVGDDVVPGPGTEPEAGDEEDAGW